MVDTILGELSPQFDQLYSKVGRPSIPPEHLLRPAPAGALQRAQRAAPHGAAGLQPAVSLVRGLAMDDPIWTPRCSPKPGAAAPRRHRAAFFERVRAQAEQRGLLSDEHFTVDGTLIDAWASLKSFQRKDAPPTARTIRESTVNFHGERRRNATTPHDDPQALLYRKGPGGSQALLPGTC